MKALLLGGTGAIGSFLTKILADKGCEVFVTSRKRYESTSFVKYKLGNAMEFNFLKEILLEKWDVIVDFMVYTEETFKNRYNLILNSTSHYMFLSSARVYANTNKPLIEESERLLETSLDNDFLATSEYSLSKARQENILYASNNTNWTIIRPYITYSENRLQLGTLEKEDWLYRALNKRPIVFSKDINDHFTTMTYGYDIASAIASLINNREAFGRTYHITNENACKWSEILDIYLDVIENKLGYRPPVVYQELNDFLKWNPNKYQVVYDRLFDRKFDCTKINEFINTSDFISVKEGLALCLNNFLAYPKFKNINWKKEALKDKVVKKRTPLKEISGIKNKMKYFIYRI